MLRRGIPALVEYTCRASTQIDGEARRAATQRNLVRESTNERSDTDLTQLSLA